MRDGKKGRELPLLAAKCKGGKKIALGSRDWVSPRIPKPEGPDAVLTLSEVNAAGVFCLPRQLRSLCPPSSESFPDPALTLAVYPPGCCFAGQGSPSTAGLAQHPSHASSEQVPMLYTSSALWRSPNPRPKSSPPAPPPHTSMGTPIHLHLLFLQPQTSALFPPAPCPPR